MSDQPAHSLPDYNLKVVRQGDGGLGHRWYASRRAYRGPACLACHELQQ